MTWENDNHTISKLTKTFLNVKIKFYVCYGHLSVFNGGKMCFLLRWNPNFGAFALLNFGATTAWMEPGASLFLRILMHHGYKVQCFINEKFNAIFFNCQKLKICRFQCVCKFVLLTYTYSQNGRFAPVFLVVWGFFHIDIAFLTLCIPLSGLRVICDFGGGLCCLSHFM